MVSQHTENTSKPSSAPRTQSRLILLPGLGVDHRFFHLQRAAFPNLEVSPWLAPEPREPLAHYAERMAAGISRQHNELPLILGGVSMGGAIALEMARHLKPACIVLIASFRHPSCVRPLLRVAERASRILPTILIKSGRSFGPAFLGRGGTVPPLERAKLAEMLLAIPPEFLRWGARAIMEWTGASDLRAEVRQIHGERDWVIPPERIQRIEPRVPIQLVPNGSHVLNLSHPAEVNAFLLEALQHAGRSRHVSHSNT